MARARKRIATETGGTPLGADNPFAGLETGTFGSGPEPAGPGAGGPGESPAPPASRPGRGPRLEVRREVRGRGGKTVTALRTGEFRKEAYARDLLRELKQALGCGGSWDAAAGVLLLQGDRIETVTGLLEGKGFRVVRTGG